MHGIPQLRQLKRSDVLYDISSGLKDFFEEFSKSGFERATQLPDINRHSVGAK
jgi:hypothetical protein